MKRSSTAKKDTEYLEGLSQKDPLVLRTIYQKFFPGILKHVTDFGGAREDAEDVFQDALIVFFRQIKSGQFKLTSSFYTYLFGICKKIWLKNQSKKGKQSNLLQSVSIDKPDEEAIESNIIKTEKYKLYREKFRLLGEDCQKVLELFFGGMEMKEIAVKMGYASEGYAKKRKFKCKKKLIDLIQEDRRFNELKL